jgi:molybdopterin/thiamine biosynthesis adenylyltransferase
MTQKLHHELVARGSELLEKLASTRITICGAGALGSNLAVNLARMGASSLTIIDKDRVEESNLSTQVYAIDDVGGMKAELLRNLLYRDLAVEAAAHCQELTERNLNKLLAGSSIVIDAFDNATSRKTLFTHCKENNIHCLHAGISDQYGEVRWNETYIVPSGTGEDICDYPMTRDLVQLVVVVSSESIIRFLQFGEKKDYAITLADLQITSQS